MFLDEEKIFGKKFSEKKLLFYFFSNQYEKNQKGRDGMGTEIKGTGTEIEKPSRDGTESRLRDASLHNSGQSAYNIIIFEETIHD